MRDALCSCKMNRDMPASRVDFGEYGIILGRHKSKLMPLEADLALRIEIFRAKGYRFGPLGMLEKPDVYGRKVCQMLNVQPGIEPSVAPLEPCPTDIHPYYW